MKRISQAVTKWADESLTDERVERSRFSLFFAVVLYSVTGYLITNHMMAGSAAQLPLSHVDLFVPFVPWTGWIYISLYLLPLFPAWYLREGQDLKEAALGFMAASTLCFMIFVGFPTACARPTLESAGWSTLALEWIHQIDRPSNAFPSLHVAYSFLSALYLKRVKPRLSAVLSFWAVVISVSTLTTKQHQFIDVAAGALLAALIMYLGRSGRALQRMSPTAES